MMPVTSFAQPTTSVSLASSAPTANTTTAVQSGPYTKAQFLNTMEGSRSVKNIKEVEQLLRDYPAALELYRTKRYKVKVKYEADVERVILVEKRSSKNGSSSAARSTDAQQQKPAMQETASDVKQTRSESKRSKDADKHRSRTHSNDRTVPVASSTVTETADAAQTVANNVSSTTSASRRASKDHESLTNSQSKPDQANPNRREQSHDSRSIVSHTKSKGKKHSRDYPTALVPYVPQANAVANMQQSRALQPYYNSPLYPQQQLYAQNYYAPPALMPPQNPMYQPPYYYPQQQTYPLTYQQQPPYSAASQSKSAGNNHHSAVNSPHNYQQASRNAYDQSHVPNLPPTFHTFHPAQQYYSYPQPNLYPQQSTPFQLPTGWPSPNNFPGQHVVTPNQGYSDSRRGSKHRAYSVDMGPHGVPPAAGYPQPQQYPATAAVEQHYSHHRTHHHHHHHQSHPAETQMTSVAPPVQLASQPAAVPAPVSVDNNNEKLTIRQLNEMFVQMDPSGRLAYNSVPVFLQRFGMNLAENDLLSAAQQLNYNVAEPISARRLVHVLVKLGKIAKSPNQTKAHPFAQPQQQPLASPGTLPEDREVTDIMTQQRVPDAPSTHIHSSIYPNHWY